MGSLVEQHQGQAFKNRLGSNSEHYVTSTSDVLPAPLSALNQQIQSQVLPHSDGQLVDLVAEDAHTGFLGDSDS